MGNYESPTIEAAGGPGYKIEPQINIPVAITDVGILAEAYLYFLVFTTETLVIVHFALAAFSKTAGVSN
jgi:hypothetical protein